MPATTPASFVARLAVGGKFVGTAFVVSRRVLLTCSHVMEAINGDARVILGGPRGRRRLFAVVHQELFREGDIALLQTSSDLPSVGPKLVCGYTAEDLQGFLAMGAKISGYADIDGGDLVHEVECRTLHGAPRTARAGVVESFQIAGGIPEGISGSPCLLTAEEGEFIIGMAQLGGVGKGVSTLISSNNLAEFLVAQRGPGGRHRTARPDDISRRELSALANEVLQSTDELDLVGRTERLLNDDPARQLFQPLPLLQRLSEEDQSVLKARLTRRPTETEMGAFDPKVVEQRVKEFLAGAARLTRHHNTPNSTAPDPGLEAGFEREWERVEIDHVFDGPTPEGSSLRAVLLGAPGSGKSVLMKYVAQSFAHGRRLKFRGRKVLPLMIRLSEWCGSAEMRNNPSLETYLAECHPALTSTEWHRELSRGRILLLLDGLDEVHDPEGRFIGGGLKRAVATDYTLCPVVIACRTYAFPIFEPVFRGASIYHLEAMGGEQIYAYTRAYSALLGMPAGKLERRMREVLQNPSLAMLAGNPLLLSVICFVLAERGAKRRLAVRTQLFNEAVRLLLKRPRWVMPPLPERLRECRRPVLEFGSLALFERQTGQEKAVVLHSAQVTPSFQDAAQRAGLSPADGSEVLRDAIGRGLILARQELPANRTVYSYLHLQFHEYLAGCGLLAGDNFIGQVFERLSNPRWREVILLAIGQLAICDEADGPNFQQVVKGLVAHEDLFTPFLPRAALLLVAALPDLSALPRELIETLAWEIIDSYSDHKRLESFPDLARQLEQAFAQMASVSRGERVLPIILECLHGSPTNLRRAMAAAALVRACRLYNRDIVACLLAIYPQDQPEWRWPVDSALREAASSDVASDLLDEVIPFRRLKDNPEKWARFVAEPLWHWMAVVLFGGLDAGTVEKVRGARRAAAEASQRHEAELGKSEVNLPERNRLENEKKAADNLVRELQSQVHVLAPQHFHRPGPLNDWFWKVFESELPVAEALEELYRRLPAIEDEAERIDAVLALACTLPATALLPWVRDQDHFAKAITRLDAGFEVTVEPALNQALGTSANDGTSVLSLVEEGQQGVFIAAVSRATWRYTAAQPFTLDAADSMTDPEAKAARFAEFFHRAFFAQEDRVYNWCVTLDTVGKKLGGDPEILLRTLASAHQAGNAKPWETGGWPLDPLAPCMIGKPRPALLGQALDALNAIPDNLDFVRSWAMTCLAPLIREAGIADEAKLLALSSLSARFDAQFETLRALSDEVELGILERGQMVLFRALRRNKVQADDPYVDCRLTIALGLTFDQASLRQLGQVPDPVLRGWLLEQAAAVAEPSEQDSILQAARLAASKIPRDDQDNKTRAVLRLAALDASTSDEVLHTYLQELTAELRAGTDRMTLLASALATIQPYVQGRPLLLAAFKTARDLLPEDDLRHVVEGLIMPDVRLAMFKEPGSMTVLGAAAAMRDFRQLLKTPDDVDRAWLELATTNREKALLRLCEAAQPTGVRLTRAGAMALDRLAEREDWETIRSVMPLLRKVDKVTLPTLIKLCRHPDPEISAHALLLRVECEGLRKETVPLIAGLLRRDEYLIRSRAALALHGDRTEESPFLRASRLGGPVLEELVAQMEDEYSRDLRVSLILVWTMERVFLDDAEMLRNWVSVGAGEDARGRTVRRLLSCIRKTNQEVWTEMLNALENSPPNVQGALLKSICAQAACGDIKNKRSADLTFVLGRLEISKDADFGYVEDGPGQIVAVARQSLETFDFDEAPDRGQIASACRREFLARRQTLAGMLKAHPASEWESQLAIIGSQRTAGDHYNQKLLNAGREIDKQPDILRILVPWLLEELSRQPAGPNYDTDYIYVSGDLLGVLAEGSEHFPGDFRELVQSSYPLLTSRLVKAATACNTFTGRQAAFRLLAVLAVVNPHVADAIYASIRDVVPVQTTVTQTLRFYKGIDSAFVATLLQKLQTNNCSTTRYLTSRMLGSLARNVFLDANVRARIVKGCQEALNSPRLQENVYLVENIKVNGDEDIYRLVNCGRLDRLLYQSLLDLSGVAI